MTARRLLRVIVPLAALLLAAGDRAVAQDTPPAGAPQVSAWQALEAGDHEAAAAAFREAIARHPRDAHLHLGAAASAFARRRDAEAIASARQALALDPQLVLAREILGRALHRTGDLDAALATFEALAAARPDDTSLQETLDRWRREAALRDRMLVSIGNGVSVSFEGPEDATLAEKAIASIERSAPRICEALSYCAVRQVNVVLYTTEQFRDITRSPAWAAGAFDGTIRVPMRGALDVPAELDRVLAHEYVHALVHELAPGGVPTWLDEGLAAALEREAPGPPTRGAGPTPSLASLATSFGTLPRRDAEQAYAFSRYAVRRLLDEAGGAAVTSLLRDLGAGVPFDRAFAARMPRTLGDFESSLATSR